MEKRIYLRVTNRCNRACYFCFYKNDPKPIGDMSLETLSHIIRQESIGYTPEKPLYIEFTGGEPLLYKNLKQSLILLNNFDNITITVETNGTLFDSQEFLEVLPIFRKNNNFIKISINSFLINSDPTWLSKIRLFTKFARDTGINYRLNIRTDGSRADLLDLKRLIDENELQSTTHTNLNFYRLRDENLYRDGTLTCPGGPVTIYDFDGSILLTTA